MKPAVLFFDVNESLLDLKAMYPAVQRALQGQEQLVPLWFSTMLHYSLVHTLGNHYKPFPEIGMAALQMVGRSHGIEISDAEAHEAIAPILSLPAHPDVPEALALLNDKGYRCLTLTNSSLTGVQTQVRNAGLTDCFENALSIESVGYFKPHPRVYQWAAEQVGESLENCMLIAAHPWDTAGAMWAGMQAAYLARSGHAFYPLAPEPTLNGVDLMAIARQLT